MNYLLYTIVGIVGLIVGAFIAFLWASLAERRRSNEARIQAEKALVEAKEEARRILERAEKDAAERWERERREFERQTRAERKELEAERRQINDARLEIEKLRDSLNSRERSLRDFQKNLKQKEKALSAREQRIEEKNRGVISRLEHVARMTRDEAREELMKSIESHVRYEAAQMAYRIKEEARLKAEREAKEIIASAIQRCAASHAAETTITVVPLPSDDIKGRIIGREGRNIRAFEAATGVEVIIDDTPEAATLSSFDPVRREIARITMESLIKDGRIHPARIEEVVEKAKRDFENYVREVGQNTLLELALSDMNPELIVIVGRMKFRSSYGQNLLQHSLEVARLSGLMASELGLDADRARRAGLLHDIGKTSEMEGPHATIGAQMAKRLGEEDLIVNAIAAHHEDESPLTPIAVLVAAADAISGARPGARRETLEAYIKRIEKLEEIAAAHPGVEASYAMQAGRELRVIVEAENVSDAEAMDLAKSIAEEVEASMEYPGQIKVVVIRETRAIEYAR
ncbi:MAG: ribonuclease Y [candidate division WOR-3 bacterium]